MYGGDGLDPTDMEGKDKPLDYNRVFSHVQVSLALHTRSCMTVKKNWFFFLPVLYYLAESSLNE